MLVIEVDVVRLQALEEALEDALDVRGLGDGGQRSDLPSRSLEPNFVTRKIFACRPVEGNQRSTLYRG